MTINKRNNRPGNAAADGLVMCAVCGHFSYFENIKGHNSPQALGRCTTHSWDGNIGQWPMFRHRCEHFVPTTLQTVNPADSRDGDGSND
jgi:hypothetical protein